MAAVLSAKVAANILKELEYKIDYQVFWTDSEVVLGYIKNSEKRFKLFVANRIALINQLTQTKQRRYVCTKNNPADLTSRGSHPKQSKWIDMY